MQLFIDDHHEQIAEYLNGKLCTDPEFLGDFGPENTENVTNFD